MDYFGVFVVGLITGTGGGILRSILIDANPPAILQSPDYLLIAIAATVFAFVGAPLWNRIKRVISIFDAFGLGLFTCLGIRVAQSYNMASRALIVLGCHQRHLRRKIYATAAIVGAYILLGLDRPSVASPAAITIVTLSNATIHPSTLRIQ